MNKSESLVARWLATCAFVAIAWAPPTLMAQSAESSSARLERLERALSNKGLLDLAGQVEQLQMEVRQLRGEVENQLYTIEQIRNGQREMYGDLDRRVGSLEQVGAGAAGTAPGGYIAGANPPADPPLPTLPVPTNVAVAGSPSPGQIAVETQRPSTLLPPAVTAPPTLQPQAEVPTNPQTAAPTGAQTNGTISLPTVVAPAATYGGISPDAARAPRRSDDSPESEAAYREAFSMLKAGQYEESIAAFNAFLQQFPSSQYADNAQYWQGEAYYVMRQFEPAIAQYQTLIAHYPDSQKQSHALLKIAYSYSELGLDEQALAVLTDLKTRFPGSAAARLADERMQRIRADLRLQ